MTTQREKLELAMEQHYGPEWAVEFACDQHLRQYARASDTATRARVRRNMQLHALELCERMAAVCVTAGLVTVPDADA
jgi:hypothetical protein